MVRRLFVLSSKLALGGYVELMDLPLGCGTIATARIKYGMRFLEVN